MRRRHDAGAALRGGPGDAVPLAEMVVAEGVGDEGCARCGARKGIVTLARRLAVVMHRMWVDGTTFRATREEAAAHA